MLLPYLILCKRFGSDARYSSYLGLAVLFSRHVLQEGWMGDIAHIIRQLDKVLLLQYFFGKWFPSSKGGDLLFVPACVRISSLDFLYLSNPFCCKYSVGGRMIGSLSSVTCFSLPILNNYLPFSNALDFWMYLPPFIYSILVLKIPEFVSLSIKR